MTARRVSALTALTASTAFTSLAGANDSADEAQIMAITVMVTAMTVENCAHDDGTNCKSGAGVILAIDRDGYPLVYTARHLATDVKRTPEHPVEFMVRLRSGEQIPAAMRWESDRNRDLLVLRLERAPSDTATLSCRSVAIVNELTSQTELAAIGAPDWTWSRLNRFNRADDQFVYMETPADKDGFSGGPVFVRGTLELLGLYQQGSEGVVRVARLDALPEEALPEKLAGRADGAPVLEHLPEARERQLGCRMKGSRFLQGRDTTLRWGIGIAQLDSPVQQLASPLASVALGGDSSLVRLGIVNLALYGSVHLGGSYFDAGNESRTFYGQGLINLGVRFGIGPAFVDALWAPGAYVLRDDVTVTARSFRVALGRRMGDGVAGLVGGYLSRAGEPGIATLELFSDFVVSSSGGSAMPGSKPVLTGNPRVDAVLAGERQYFAVRAGASAMTASDQHFGWGGGIGVLQVPIALAGASTPSVGVQILETLELQAGSVQVREENSLYLGYAAEIGPRLRVGAPTSLLIDAFYYVPLITYYDDRVRFPLVGAGAGLGFKVDSFAVRTAYKYQYTQAIYPAEPNLTFMSLTAQVDLW